MSFLYIPPIILGLMVFFVVARELITWYWKINRAIELLEKIEENTRKDKNV
jgi:hypothetical protein